jgi:hypothetical protein
VRSLVLYRQPMIIGVALIAIGIGAFLLAVLPALFEAYPLYQQLRTEEDKWHTLAMKSQRLQDLSSIPGFDQRDKVDQLLPNEKPLAQLLSSVTSTLQAANMPISNLQLSPGVISTSVLKPSPSPSSSGSGSGTTGASPPPTSASTNAVVSSGEKGLLAVSFQTRGTLTQIYGLLRSFENTAPIAAVTQLTLQNEKQGEVTNQIAQASDAVFTANMQVTASYFDQVVSFHYDGALPEIGETEQQMIQQLTQFSFPAPQAIAPTQPGNDSTLFNTTPFQPASPEPTISAAPAASPSATPSGP